MTQTKAYEINLKIEFNVLDPILKYVYPHHASVITKTNSSLVRPLSLAYIIRCVPEFVCQTSIKFHFHLFLVIRQAVNVNWILLIAQQSKLTPMTYVFLPDLMTSQYKHELQTK